MRTIKIVVKMIMAVLVISSWIQANNINAGGQKGLIRTMTTETHGLGALTIGGAIKYDIDREYVVGVSNNDQIIYVPDNSLVSHEYAKLFSGDLYAVYGVHQAWDIGIDLPVYHDKTGWGEDHTDFGNLEISTKLGYPFTQEGLFINQAYYLKVILPTGGQGSGHFPRHAYYIKQREDAATDRYTSNYLILNPMMIWTMNFDRLNPKIPVKIHANLGGAINSSSAVIAAIGVELKPVDDLSIFLEISGESRVIHYIDYFSLRSFNNDIFIITPGARYTFKNGMHAALAVDIGVQDWHHNSRWEERGYRYQTKGVPLIGFQFSLGWSGMRRFADTDKDGIINKLDKCPQKAEDKDGFQDEDGCPDIDNDNDGVLDYKDKCPNTPTIVQGCPVVDVDEDGIENVDDKCPEAAEDFDKFEDEDGCPEQDNDNDMIFDDVDKCPNKAEDDDGFQDEDGCPDIDNDEDGVKDAEDKCPNHKGLSDNAGCPAAAEIKRGELMLLNVSFQTGKAKLNRNSYTILDKVIESLEEWKEIRLEVQGHTDNVGSDETNRKLSQSRAQAVVDYFISKGISLERLKAIGYGEAVPIADNKSAEGRERNRRVQLKRID